MIRPLRTTTIHKLTLDDAKAAAQIEVHRITGRGDDFIRVEIDRASTGYVAHVDWAEGDTA